MKTIREKAKENVQELSYETLHDWAVSEHTSRTHRWVEVHPDGDVSETEEADNNTTHWVDYPNKEVASIYEISAESCEPCNCDICCLYRHYEDCNGDKEEFLYSHSEEDWEYCEENTWETALRDSDSLKSASDIRNEMLDAIDEIYYGYFDDETSASEITTIEGLADYINAADEWPADVEDIIEQNGWVSDTGETHGICHNDEKRLIFDGDDNTAIVITDNEEFTYDVMFNDETKSDTMGFKSSLQECINFIDLYNGNPNVPYFGDYNGGIVQIVNNETKDIVFTAEVL